MKISCLKTLSFFVVLSLMSCGNQTDNIDNSNSDSASIDSNSIAVSDTSTIDLPKIFSNVDTNESVKIITIGTFHGDEVWDNVENGVWYDIFSDPEEDDYKRDYFLEETDIIAKRVHDEIVDENETIQTGWEINVEGKTESLLLIQGVELPQGILKHVVLDNLQIFPGDTITFMFEQRVYNLFATGTAILDYEMSELRVLEDYKLFLTTTKNDQEITELLVAHDNFDDAMVSVLFIGDIDGDGFPDLIIDTSRHYNVDNPTLYLSKGTGENQLLQIVGWHRSVGC